MLKFTVQGSKVRIEEAYGNIRTVCAELCLAIRGLYDTIKEDSPKHAEFLRECLCDAVQSSEFWEIEEDTEAQAEDDPLPVRVDWDAIRKTIEGAEGK